jgi:hypothetical protein
MHDLPKCQPSHRKDLPSFCHRKFQGGYLEQRQEEIAQKLRNMNQVKEKKQK